MSARDSRGFTAAHYAVMSDNVGVLSRLREVGVDLFEPAADTGRTPFHIAACCDSFKCVHLLLKEADRLRLDPAATDKAGKTPLWMAIFYKNDSLACMLRDQLDDPNDDTVNLMSRAAVKTPAFARALLGKEQWEASGAGMGVGKQHNEASTSLGYCNMTNVSEDLIEKKFISIYLKVAWQDFARVRACWELALYFLYSFIFTLLYLMNGVVWNDYTESNYTKPSSDSTLFKWYIAIIVGYVVMTIVIAFLGIRKIKFKSDQHRAALRMEKRYLEHEQLHLHPHMVHEKLELEEEALVLKGMSGILGTASVMKLNIFDLSVHLGTFLVTLGYLALKDRYLVLSYRGR
eukprot:sb/3466281/